MTNVNYPLSKTSGIVTTLFQFIKLLSCCKLCDLCNYFGQEWRNGNVPLGFKVSNLQKCW